MKSLRVAVVGVGHLGRVHARILAALRGVRLVGVADPHEATRQAVAADCHTAAFADHRALAERIDAAVVAAPTTCHCQVAGELLARGIHVLVEKPLAATLEEAEHLVRAARHHGVVLQVGHVERFNPALGPALPYVQSPKFVQATRLGGFTGRSPDIGVVLDLMIHDIDLLLSMVRAPLTGVEALGISVLGGHEDAANARLRFANGCVATLNASRVSPCAARTMQVWSPAGFTSLDFAARTATVLRPGDDVLAGRLDIGQLSLEERQALRERFFEDVLVRESFEPPPADQLTEELEDFVDAIRSARQPRVNGEQGRDAVAVAQRVLEAIAAHRWDGTADGRVGPFCAPQRGILPGPHWHRSPAPAERKEAG